MLKLLLVLSLWSSSFSKEICLNALADENPELVMKAVGMLEKTSVSNDQKAYLGALKMKQAGYLKTPGEKLEAFKHGRTLLEQAIKSEPNNTEYRFLRLIIQEHLPKMLKYNFQIHKDAAWIKEHYKSTSPDIRKHILRYAETSKSLNL